MENNNTESLNLIGPDLNMDGLRFAVGQKVRVITNLGACPGSVGTVVSVSWNRYMVAFGTRGQGWLYFPRWLVAA